jgi:2-phospho-L-lactate guanylyltransferase (CobY/MobA/RfbA family)
MGMIIPLYVDKNKDSRLIEFLDNQTNRSAFVRLLIYQYIDKINISIPVNMDHKEDNKKYMNGFINFKKG